MTGNGLNLNTALHEQRIIIEKHLDGLFYCQVVLAATALAAGSLTAVFLVVLGLDVTDIMLLSQGTDRELLVLITGAMGAFAALCAVGALTLAYTRVGLNAVRASVERLGDEVASILLRTPLGEDQ